MRTLVANPQAGIASLVGALTGGGDAIEQNANRDETRRLSDIALRASRERRNNASAGLDEHQLTSRQGLGESIRGTGIFPNRDPSSVAGVINAGNAADPTVGLGNLAKLILEQNVRTGATDPTMAAQGRFAARGGNAPFSQNTQGSVLNAGTGTVDQTNPIAGANVQALSSLATQRDASAGLDSATTGQVTPLAEALIGQRNRANLLGNGSTKPVQEYISPAAAEVANAEQLLKQLVPPELHDALTAEVNALAAGQIKALTRQGVPFIQAAQQVADGLVKNIAPGDPGIPYVPFTGTDAKFNFTGPGTTPQQQPAAVTPQPESGIAESLGNFAAKAFGGDSTSTQDTFPPGTSPAQALAEARDAIAAGKDPAIIREMLLRNGIDPAGL